MNEGAQSTQSANITIKTIKGATLKLSGGNSLLYEFIKSRKYHSCWLRWIPTRQAGRTYIRIRVFNEMLNQKLIREYHKEETVDFIRRYYVLAEA